MTEPMEYTQDFCLDTNVPVSHHKRKRSWSETRNLPTDIFQDSYLTWKPEHIPMQRDMIAHTEQNSWNTCKTSVRVLITLACILSAYICFIYSFKSIAKHF